MTREHALQMRLRIYLRREEYVWLSRRGKKRVNFGWIISLRKGSSVLFKDDEEHRPTPIPVKEIESCGVV